MKDSKVKGILEEIDDLTIKAKVMLASNQLREVDRILLEISNKSLLPIGEIINKTFYDRLKEEREELKERLDKLNVFLHKLYVEGTAFVTDTQAHYLKEQREYMQGYLDVLDKRLENLKESNIVVIGKE